MKAKEFLSSAYKMDRQTQVLAEKIRRLRSMLDYRSPPFDGIGGGGSSDRMSDTVSMIVDYERQLQELQKQLVTRYIEIDGVISKVDDEPLREVLERRYLLYQKWDQIAAAMSYSERHVHRLHSAALQLINMSLNVTL